MGRHEKTLDKWKKNLPNEARLEEVKSLLNYYGLELSKPSTTGSHYLLHHEELDAFKKQSTIGSLKVLDNVFVIPVHNNKVKKIYLKVIVHFIVYLYGGK